MAEKKLTKKEKVLIGAAVVGAGVAGYFGVKYLNSKNKIIVLEDNVNTLMEAASEGLYEEAEATVTRKVNHIKDQIEYCIKRLDSNPADKQTRESLEKYRIKLDLLSNRKAKFVKAQDVYRIIVDEDN